MLKLLSVSLLFALTASLSHAQGERCASLFVAENQFELTNFEPLSRGNFQAMLRQEKVFLKKLRGNSQNEVTWLTRLNQLGLGVRFFGITKIQEQQYMIIENAPGVNTQMPMLAPSDFRLTKTAVTEIKRQAELLASEGISPLDLQFQVSPDGRQVKIIDPELFRMALSLEAAHKETNTILNNIFSVWAMEGKIEF